MTFVPRKPALGLAVALVMTGVCAHASIVTTSASKMTTVALTPDLHGPNGTNPGVLYSIADSQGVNAAADPLMFFDLSSLAGGRVLGPVTLTMTVLNIWFGDTLTANLAI